MTGYLPRRWCPSEDVARHAEAIAAILETPPIMPRSDGLVIFSHIGTAAMLPYLVAVKSLWHRLGRGRVAILDDGTLTGEDRAILAHHCGDPDLLPISSRGRGERPAAGCDRLLTILGRRASEYWIQLDSDTVTLGAVPEVERAIASNRSFLLPASPGAAPLPLRDFAAQYYPEEPAEGSARLNLESQLGQLSGSRGWRYVSGWGGIAGFAAGGGGRTLVDAFVAEITALHGSQWLEVGGFEEIACNFVIANEPEPVLLPHERYLSDRGDARPEDAAVVRFPAGDRHGNGAYTTASEAAIAALTGR